MTVKAIDVSSWQHPGGAAIDWSKVKADGYAGVWIKCTQGVDYLNPYFHGDVEGALAAGLVVGAYHFATPSQNDAASEAAYALNACKGLPLALGVALDLEQLGTLAPHEAGPWAEQWLSAIAAEHALAPLYTDQSIFGQLVGAPWGYPLWIADPSGTFEGAYWAKQTGKGTVAGVEGPCDEDVITNIRGVNPPAPPGVPTTTPTTPAAPTGGGPTTAPSGPTTGGQLDVNVPELSITNPGPSVESGAVKTLQTILVDRFGVNLQPSGGIDGKFGPATEDAVKWVQGESHGALKVDGVVGPETWTWLVNFNG